MQIKIVSKKKSDDCFESTVAYDYELSEPWTSERILKFQEEKVFNYYTFFPKPMFKVITNTNIHIKGLEGDLFCRVIYPSDTSEENIRKIENKLINEI